MKNRNTYNIMGKKKMIKYTQKQLRAMVADGIAIDATNATNETRRDIENVEGYLLKIGYSCGIYGCNGLLFKGNKTGKLYAVTARTTAIFILD